MSITRKEVIAFIEWLGGSINPFTHNAYFNSPRSYSDDIYEDQELYLQDQRKVFITAHGEALIPVLIDIILHPPELLDDDFYLEFKAFISLYKGSIYEPVIKEGILTGINKGMSKQLLIATLGELADSSTLIHFNLLIQAGLKEEELISLIGYLGDLYAPEAFELLQHIQNTNTVSKSEAIKKELELVMSFYNEK